MAEDANGPPVLEVEGLSVELSVGGVWVQALDGVSLRIRRGEVLGLVGESGSGKSLTALSISRLLPDNARVLGGAIRLMGEDVLAKGERELERMRSRSLALIFQNPTSYLNPLLTVGDQIAEIFALNPELLASTDRPRPSSRREIRHQAWRKSVEYLGLVKIPDPERIVRQYPFQLSGGMQQRVVIAMALARRPSLIIADEITTALDVTIQAQILALLAELQRVMGMTLLLITHDMGIVAQLADHVAVMYSGSVVECSDVGSLFRDAQHPYSRALLEAVPTLRGTESGFRPIPGAVPSLTEPPSGCRFHPRCPLVFEPCASAKPPPLPTGPGRTVACHRYGVGTRG
jgi:oligopeptide/dipeptide ABC transporter ATP-binding protein